MESCKKNKEKREHGILETKRFTTLEKVGMPASFIYVRDSHTFP